MCYLYISAMLEKIVIIDFGSQTTQLIARRIRELNIYCEIIPYQKFSYNDSAIIGIILSGSPYSVHEYSHFNIDFSHNIPILGICYGAQLIAHLKGGTIEKAHHREFGRAKLSILNSKNILLQNIKNNSTIWMSHSDTITKLPNEFEIIASTDKVKNTVFQIKDKKIWGVQFHPEVYHSEEGITLLKNFACNICHGKQTWNASSFIEKTIENLRQNIKNDKVVLGLSGGVDSSVTAVLLNKAIGKNLTCIFVNHGMLRKNEFNNVLHDYECLGLNVRGIDASQKFLNELEGVTDPEKKRKIIGKGFVDVFNEEAQKIEGVKWLAQGTIYPDCIESLSITGTTIKSHHNVGGLPKKMNLKLCEPLRLLFKDEVRHVGRELGMPEHLIIRHPFPGPGLAVRILGNITREKVHILQEADEIFIQNLREWNLYNLVWQAGVILLPVQSVGVMGDERTYEYAVALRAVTSTDAMTADWAHLPYEFMAKVSNDIINKVKGVNRVCYDISSKPPATIEWE